MAQVPSGTAIDPIIVLSRRAQCDVDLTVPRLGASLRKPVSTITICTPFQRSLAPLLVSVARWARRERPVDSI